MNRPTTDEELLHNLVFKFTMVCMMGKEDDRREEKMKEVKSLWREFGIRHGWVENEPTQVISG